MPTPTHRDPRSIITPDAFEVSPELVGMPLASPARRAAALAIDGVVILGITALTNSFSLILGVIAGGLFVRAGFKRTPVRGNVFGRAMRFSVGCLGVLIAGATVAAVWAGTGFGGANARDVAETAGQVVRGLDVLEAIEAAETREEALGAAESLLVTAESLGLSDDIVRAALVELAPEEADWSVEWPAVVDSLLGAEPEPVIVAEDLSEVTAEVAQLPDDEVLGLYASLRNREELDEAEQAQYLAVEARARGIVAGDTLGSLERRVAALRRQSEARQEALDESQAEVEAAENRGIFRRILDLADDLGFGFGWAALYMTVILSWWKGQTVGKKAMGIRVVRLDGGPITWWVAFERVGGYAAGLATGLLGFAQVWWDANRQTIHDRIVGTVVVEDGAEKVLDWESAL